MIRSYLHSLRTFSRDVRLCLVATALLGFTISGGIYSVLLNLYLLRLGYGTAFIGLVNAMLPLAVVLFSLPASTIGGRWGIHRTMIVGMILSVAGNGLLPVAEFAPDAAREAWILVAYLIAGLGHALYLVNLSPFLMDASRPEERNQVFSMRIALLPLAGFAGSLIGGLMPRAFASVLNLPLTQPAPYRYPLFIAAALLSPAVLVLLAVGKEKDGTAAEPFAEASPGSPLEESRTAVMSLIVFVSFVGFLRVMGEGMPRAFFNVYLDAGLRVPTAQIGVVIAIARLLAVPAGLAMPFLAARWGNARTIVFGALGVSVSLLPLALVPHWLVAGLGYMSMTALAAIARSAFIVFALEAVPPRWRPTMSAATTMSASVSWGATAFVGGYLIESQGYQSVFLVGAVSIVAGALLFWLRFCRTRQ